MCKDSSECVEIDYSSLSQGASLAASLGDELSYNDTAEHRAFACLPRPRGCEKQFVPTLIPASIGNTQLGYEVGEYNFTETDLCPPSNEADSTNSCVLEQLTNGTSSPADVESEFRSINQLLPDNVGQWCGSASDTFLVRSVPGMQDCGWKKCVQQLSYEGLQHVRYNTETGGCAGIFTPHVKGIRLKGSWLKGDLPCQFSGAGNCDDGDSFCQACLDGPGLSGYECKAGGEVSHDIKTVNNWYCAGAGNPTERCVPCHVFGPNPSPG